MATIERIPAAYIPQDVIPSVVTDVFTEVPEAHFWIGITAEVGNEINMLNEHTAAGVLRANVYIDETHYLNESSRLPDGTETDRDDTRSTHFAVIENALIKDGLHRVVGNARLINRSVDDPLPIETFFPEAFEDEPADHASVEASRYIARHSDRLTQNLVAFGLIRSMVYQAEQQGSPFIYAVVEDHLLNKFSKIGLPMKQLADTKVIEKYDNTPNTPVRFSPAEILDTAARDSAGSLMMSHFFKDATAQGLGHFDHAMIEHAQATEAA